MRNASSGGSLHFGPEGPPVEMTWVEARNLRKAPTNAQRDKRVTEQLASGGRDRRPTPCPWSVTATGHDAVRCRRPCSLSLPLSASRTLIDAKCGWWSIGSARLAAFLIPCHPERACEPRGPPLEVNGHCSLASARLRLPDTVPGHGHRSRGRSRTKPPRKTRSCGNDPTPPGHPRRL
jgi:hypothetical protein